MHTFKKFSAARSAAKFFYILFRRASRGAAWPLHFKFASYAYGMHSLVVDRGPMLRVLGWALTRMRDIPLLLECSRAER